MHLDIKTMPKVFIPQISMRRRNPEVPGDLIPAHDLTPAMVYGQLITLLEPGPFMIDVTPMVRTFRNKLKDFCDNDYIVAVGDPAAIAAATMVAGSANHGRVKLLRWDRNVSQYLSLQIDIFERKNVHA